MTMAVKRYCNEVHEKVCESKLNTYGFILTYGSTAGQVKTNTLGGYAVGVATRSTKKHNGTITSSVRVGYVKTGLVDIKIGNDALADSFIEEGDAIMSDASGCAKRMAKASYITTSNIEAANYAKIVAIAKEAKESSATGHIKAWLTLHNLPKP